MWASVICMEMRIDYLLEPFLTATEQAFFSNSDLYCPLLEFGPQKLLFFIYSSYDLKLQFFKNSN